MERLHAIVSGKVQGVSFRYYTQRTAHELGVTGWVRNKPDGTVETVAEGDKEHLEKFLAFLQQGSLAARVREVEVTWQPATTTFKGFEIR